MSTAYQHRSTVHSIPRVIRDTRAWRIQVWVSFGLAAFLCATGLAYLPGEAIDRAFMVMGYVFCLTTVFVLSKAIRDNQAASSVGDSEDSPLWRFVTWGGFGVAMSLTGWGLLRMEVNETYRAFMGVCWLYLVTTAFTLAKTLRDQHEADLADAHRQGAREARSNMLDSVGEGQAVASSDA